MSNSIFGLPIDALILPMEWSLAVMIVGLFVDAMGRRQGEPDPPSRPELHSEIESWLKNNQRLAANVDASAKPERI